MLDELLMIAGAVLAASAVATRWIGIITLSARPAALARGQAIRAKLVPYQGAFGVLAICTGATYVASHII